MMNNKLKSTIAAVFSAAILTACSSNQKADQSVDHAHHETSKQAETEQKQDTAQTKDAVLNAILPYYHELQQALVEEDIAKAKEAALLIEEGAGKLSEDKSLAPAATAVMTSNSLAEQREAFAILSKHYIALIRQAGLISGELYVAHCPMAFDQQGADWLASNKSLKNPYFGAQMLTCGSIEETLH